MRKTEGVLRGEPFAFSVDGDAIQAYPRETIATAMLAADATGFRRDRSGRARGLFCNMGVCSECLVHVRDGDVSRRVRACLVPAAPGMTVETGIGE
ncbi:(2Fe-2S)-binding protein [Brevundimonas sp. NPDC055814]